MIIDCLYILKYSTFYIELNVMNGLAVLINMRKLVLLGLI